MHTDEQGYWCFRHQAIEPLSWQPHPDHLRIGPLSVAEARGWRDEPTTPWAAPVLPLDEGTPVS